jgi:secreted PhoX family phosphatase
MAFDKRGNLWILRDGNALKSDDSLFAVPVEGRHCGRMKQLCRGAPRLATRSSRGTSCWPASAAART